MLSEFLLKDMLNYNILSQFCLSQHYKVVRVHIPGEEDSFNTHTVPH